MVSTEAARLAQKLRAWLAHQESAMAGLLEELVTVPTENPPGTCYPECAALLRRDLVESRLTCESLEVPAAERKGAAPRIALLAEWGHGQRALYFHGHYDVVPAQSRTQFDPRRKGHFLFGRGAADMKGGIVAMLYAIRALRECGAQLDGRVALTLVPDEETGGTLGSAWLAGRGLLGRDAIGMLTAEPTSGLIWNANRGAITLRVHIFGKPAHVGLHFKGANAFERAHRVVQELLRYKRRIEKRKTRYQIAPARARQSILLIGGQSGGGTNFNVVPGECWFTVDRRINPEEDFQAERAGLLGVLERCRRQGVPLEIKVLQEGMPSGCATDGMLGRALARSVTRVTGRRPRFELCPGLLENRFYAAQGIPAYAYGPGQFPVAHGPNEFVDLRKLAECAAVYALTAARVLAPQAG